MSWVFVAVTVVSTAVTMYSQYQQGKAQEAMYQAQADQAQEEARQEKVKANIKSNQAQDQGMAESRKLKKQQLKILGKQKASLAAMGISGVTAEDIMTDTLQVQDMDMATLHYNSDLASWEAKTTGDYNSWALEQSAEMSKTAKINTARSTKIAMTGTLLKSATSIAGGFSSGALSTGGMKTPMSTGTNPATASQMARPGATTVWTGR